MDNVEEFKNVRVGFLHKEKGCRCDSMSRGRKFPLTKFLLRSPEYSYLIREISAIPPDHEVVFIIILIKNLRQSFALAIVWLTQQGLNCFLTKLST